MHQTLFIDIEATGLNTQHDEIIEICIAKKNNEHQFEVLFHQLIKPIKKIDQTVSSLTSITNSMVSNEKEFYHYAETIYDIIKDSRVIAHKADFDIPILYRMLEQTGFTPQIKVLCTLKLSQKLLPGLKSYSLASLCNLMGIKCSKPLHRAYPDTKNLFYLYQKLSHMMMEPKQISYTKEQKSFLKNVQTCAAIIKYDEKEQVVENCYKHFKESIDYYHKLDKVIISYYPSMTHAFIEKYKSHRYRYGLKVIYDKSFNKKLLIVKNLNKHDCQYYFINYMEAKKFLKAFPSYIPKDKTKKTQRNLLIDKRLKKTTLPFQHFIIYNTHQPDHYIEVREHWIKFGKDGEYNQMKPFQLMAIIKALSISHNTSEQVTQIRKNI